VLLSSSSLARIAGRLLAAGLVLACAGPSHAQEPAVPFSKVSLYAGGNALLSAGVLGSFYRVSPGLEAEVGTPFYVGTAGLGVGLRRFEGRDGRAGEDLWGAPMTLRWGLRSPLSISGGRLRANASVRLGVLFMRFSGGGAGLKNENELMMGAGAGLSFHLTEGWRLAAGARYARVFTSPPFPLWQVRAGVRHHFDAPRWLQTLLR
jgi:opacity protein-like surface antigen